MNIAGKSIGTWLRDPWVLGTLLGLFFVTAIRPCTRYEPPPPEPILPAHQTGLPADFLKLVQGEITLVLLPSGEPTAREAELSNTKRLLDGLQLWERKVAIRTLVEVSSNEAEFPQPFGLSQDALSDVRTNWMNFSEGTASLIGLFDREGDMRAIVPLTKDGGIEAFHTAMLLKPEKTSNP